MNALSSQAIYNFFEHPKTPTARLVHALLVGAIIVSAFLALVELSFPNAFIEYSSALMWLERVILGMFTVEYVLRFSAAPRKWAFFWHPFNLIDLAAIVPFFFGINAAAARVLRVLRLLKLARHLHLLGVFRLKETILEKIFPLLVLLFVTKILVWIAEEQGLWLQSGGLGELFAIVGFALGIILAQKITTTSEKYFAVREAFFRICAQVQSLAAFYPYEKAFLADWLEKLVDAFADKKATSKEFFPSNAELLMRVRDQEQKPSEMCILAKDITNDAHLVLCKKNDTVPAAYNLLLQQATLLYLALIVIFLPGVVGIISVLVGTYILYGMYHVTLDFDTISGGEHNLINVHTTELSQLAKALRS